MERKATVEKNMRTLGTVVDLSAGGCAIQALNPFDKGKLVMVEFDIDRKAPIRAFGKVIHVHRQKGRGGVMHVMFTRVTRQLPEPDQRVRLRFLPTPPRRPGATAPTWRRRPPGPAERAGPFRVDHRTLSTTLRR